jgi:hypothetical protein
MLATRADRVQRAAQLLAFLHRTGIDDTDETPPTPPGYCGRGPDEACGMVDPEECRTHCGPPDGDPALLSYSGTLQQRRAQLRLARRHGLRL